MRKEKAKRKSFSIRFYIFSTIAVLTLSSLAVLWIFHSIFISSAFKMAKESDIGRASNLIADNIDEGDISPLIAQVANEYELCAAIIKADDCSLLHSYHALNSCFLCGVTESKSLIKSWYSDALLNDGEYTVVFPRDQFTDPNSTGGDIDEDEELTEDCLINIRIITDDNGEEYLLILNADIAPVSAANNAIRILLIFVSVIFCTIALLIAYLLTRNLSRPIEKITKSAKELRGGDYKVRFEGSGPMEIKELAKTLNTTATELDNADQLQKELIANISHDLRTPLTMISGYSEFMRDFPSEVTPENIQVIIDETARLNSLVNDLLDVSKFQSGVQAINLKKISLTKTISDTVKRYDSLLTHKEYKISFVHEEEVCVMADETRLLQVVYNLVNNAINYTGEDKTVTIRQDVLDDIVRVSIIDTGEGISEDKLPLVWDRYYKIDKVHKRAILGTGLGLSIVKNILMLHNSRFGVSSEVGKGSIFWFELKVVKDEEPSNIINP